MDIIKTKIIILCLCLSVLMTACSPDASIVYTSSLQGHLLECGCPTDPAGGVARRANHILENHQGYDDPNLIHLDAGGFCDYLSLSGRNGSETLIELHDVMHVDAVNVTARELGEDPARFLRLIKGKKTPYISANIVEAESGEPIFKSHVTLEIKNKSIAVIGLAAPRKVTWQLEEKEIFIADPKETLNRILPELETGAVILLTDITRIKLMALLKDIKGIDLVIGADGFSLTPKVSDIRGVQCSYAGNQGKYLGTMKIGFDNKKLKIHDHKLIVMDEKVKDEPEIKAIVEKSLEKNKFSY